MHRLFSTLGIPEWYLLIWVGFLLFGLLGTLFWVWMIVDCATNESSEGNNKVVWLLVILLGHLLGALIYYFVRRPQRERETHN